MATVFEAAFGRILPFARRAVREGVGVTASRSALRDGGLRFSNAAYSQAHRAAVSIDTITNLERTAVLTSKPGATRIVRGRWGFTEKYGQVVRVQLRELATGALKTFDVNVATDRLMTRMDAIDIVVEKVVPSLEEYGVEMIDATYAHTKGQA